MPWLSSTTVLGLWGFETSLIDLCFNIAAALKNFPTIRPWISRTSRYNSSFSSLTNYIKLSKYWLWSVRESSHGFENPSDHSIKTTLNRALLRAYPQHLQIHDFCIITERLSSEVSWWENRIKLSHGISGVNNINNDMFSWSYSLFVTGRMSDGCCFTR